MKCVVLGAGVAGLVSALELLRAGCTVTVVEAGPWAGGRASSWATPAGLISGTGLHVVGAHYVNLMDVLESVGACRELAWWEDHYYLRPGRPAVLWRYNALPAPLHLLRAGLGMPAPLRIRARLALAGFDLLRRHHADLVALDDMSYLEWHRAQGLGNGFVLDLAEMAADAATFLPVERASARAVLSWLKYMSTSRAAGRIGTWRVPLSEGLIAPLVNAIAMLGGELRFRTAAVCMIAGRNGIEQVIVRRTCLDKPCYSAEPRIPTAGPEEALACDCVISALPVQYLRALLDAELAARAGLRRLEGMGTVPAISATIAFDREIRPSPAGAPLVTGCSIRDFIEVPQEQAGGAGAAFLFLVSRAEQWLARSDEEIIEKLAGDFRAAWPPAIDARPVRGVVERIGAGMFAATPGVHRLRPETTTGIRNLFLAGDWVRHDLNASMEGAALSGKLAARAACGAPVRVLEPREPMFPRAVQALFRRRPAAWIEPKTPD